jgi:hypothetical protein
MTDPKERTAANAKRRASAKITHAPELKTQLEKQAVAYRKLAAERANKLGLPQKSRIE